MKLAEFVIHAKVRSYASGNDAEPVKYPDGCIELNYQEDGFQYRDRYFGSNPFVGEEVVWQNGQIIWAMNYYGYVIDENTDSAQVYHFLQKAMGQVKEDRPYRGPFYLKEDDFEYFDQSQGDIDQFTGMEKIFFQGDEVYRLHYHGGKVQA